MTTASMITCTGCKHSYADAAQFCPNCGRPRARDAAADPLVGKLLGERFQVIELIGQGGSGTIYRAEHVTLRRKVAIKVLHTELSRDDLAVERFRREATTVAEIDNEHIVEIHDFGRTPDGRLYLAMELLEGETLDGVLARESQLSVERVADVLIQVGEALMEAHAIGYVHRDLRPRNIYLATRRGKANFVKLLDFGLSKLVESDAQAASTSLGMTFGDPRYMSPEQARGDRIDRRADIYQLGCVAYEMLTGAPPFAGNRVFDILTKQVTEIPAPLPTRRPGVPLWMEAAVAKMLAKDPENRFATTTRMVEALRRGLDTGEVMEDEIARRRESIPPPSVSRAMQRMGLSSPVEEPVGAPAPAAAVPAPAAPVPAPSAPVTAPLPAQDPGATLAGVGPSVAHEPPPRRRTGTPEIGVPVMPAPAPLPSASAPVATPSAPALPAAPQAPVTGAISAPAGRARTGTDVDPSNISQVWYDDGDRASADAEHGHAGKRSSASATDTSLYDDHYVPHRRRWPIVAGVLGLLGVGAVAFAIASGGGTKPAAPPPAPATPPPVVAAATPPAPVAPSTIVGSAAAPPAAPAPTAPSTPATPVAAHEVRETHDTHEDHAAPAHASHASHERVAQAHDDSLGFDDTGSRRPSGLDDLAPSPRPTSHPTPTPTPTKHPTSTATAPDVSGTGGPENPYADPSAPADGTPDDKKAEFYANLGQQQLASGDTASAAASFQKATELDPKDVNALMGMGDIALRQGLFGDAIAHLRKAARLAPRNSQVFTLLGEAYLDSGQNATAADDFKKALLLNPDNARAREGYNEASSRVPPPSDDN